MITARIIEYWNDYNQHERRERFQDLDAFADWIFGQMSVDYSGPQGSHTLSFPPCKDEQNIYRISLMPGATKQTLWIKLIEDDRRGILFSDGAFTAGQKYCTRDVKEWLAKCEERRKHPVFPFASDLPETDRMDDHAALPDGVVPVDRIKKAIYWIHEAGGCDATGKYGQGYDDAIVVVVNFLLDEFGLTFEEIEDYHDGQEQGLKKTYHKDNPAGSCREKRGKNMECKECVYFWQEEAEVRSSCKWVQRAPGEVALCDEEEQPYESTEWD